MVWCWFGELGLLSTLLVSAGTTAGTGLHESPQLDGACAACHHGWTEEGHSDIMVGGTSSKIFSS